MIVIDDPIFTELASGESKFFTLSSRASFFGLPEWYDVLCSHGMTEDFRPRLYLGQRAGLVCRIGSRDGGRHLRECSNLYTTEHSILLANDSTDAYRDTHSLLKELTQHNGHIDAISLAGLDPSCLSFSGALKGLREGGFVVKPYFCWGTWFELTSGISFESYVSARPSQLKNTWKRKRAALSKVSQAELSIADHQNPDQFIDDYDDVCRRSWKSPEPFPDFVPALIRLAHTKGALRAGSIRISGRPIAVQFWIIWQDRATIFKLAYDKEFQKLSPGTVLTMAMIRRALEHDHPVEINFGRGDDDYKRLWMSKRRERWGIESANPRTRRGFAASLRIGIADARDRLVRRGRRVND